MPFKSEKQRRYMFAKHPEIAKRWAKKYPTKDLPMYANNDDKEKRAVLGALGRAIKNNLHLGLNFSIAQGLGQYLKKADSKLEHIQMPQNEKPTYSGEKPINSILKPETEDEGSVGDVMAQESQCGGAKELLRKIALVAAPEIVREAERRKAQQTGQNPQPVPDNVNIKQYPVSPATPPPMNLNAPAPPQQPAQQPTQPAPNTAAQSPSAKPIDMYGGMSKDPNNWGTPNAAFGTQNQMGGEKLANDDILSEIMSIDSLDPIEQLELDEIWLDNLRAKCAAALQQQKCSCGCGQKVAECTCSKSCSCRQKGGSCYGLEVKTAGSKPGLWANIHAKRKRGEKPANPGDKDYPDAKSWNKTVKSSGLFDFLKRQPEADDWAPPTAPKYDLQDDARDWDSYDKQRTQFEKTLRQYLKTKGYSKIREHKYEPGGTPWSMLGPDKQYHEIWMPEDDEPVNKPTRLADLYDSDKPDKVYRKGPGLVLVDTSKKASSPAWQRSAGKNPEGGLNEKGRKSYERETGGNLKAPVTESKPTGERAKRQNSFCSRMCGMKRVNTGAETKSDPDSRINKSLRKWNCKCGSALEFGFTLGQALR